MYKNYKITDNKIERMIKMDENIELLEYIYKNSEMGVYTIKTLLKELKDKENKIKRLADDEMKEYNRFKDESKKIIKKYKYDLKTSGLMAKIGSKMGIKKEVDNDNSDASMAHLLTEGITMGIVDMETKLKNYKDTVKDDVYNLGEEFLKFQQGEVEKLKEFM